jgi:hypothetical protein
MQQWHNLHITIYSSRDTTKPTAVSPVYDLVRFRTTGLKDHYKNVKTTGRVWVSIPFPLMIPYTGMAHCQLISARSLNMGKACSIYP